LIRTLGRLELDGRAFTRPKPLLLLTYLCLEGAQRRRHLAELFFSAAQDRAKSLRITVMRLRQDAPDTLEATNDRLRALVPCDALELLSKLDAGDLEGGVGLYTGAFLSGLQPGGSSAELEEWVYATREFIAERTRTAQLTLAEREAARGAFEAATRRAEAALTLEGANEPRLEDLPRLYALLVAGDSSHAERVRAIASEYDLSLTLTRDEARAQLRSLENTPAPSALPRRATSFVGRDVERLELARLLTQPDVRLVTVVGPGGIGKSRLALEVASDVREAFPDGVGFVPLDGLDDATLVPGAVARAFGWEHGRDDDPARALEHLIGNQRLLIVLDNMEHLLEATGFVSRLVSACPELRLLLTSRERTKLEAEWVYPLEGMRVPALETTLEAARSFESVQLFAQRAKRSRPGFAVADDNLGDIVRIARLVEGSPLGLELASSWTTLLSPREIALEIEDNLDVLAQTSSDVPKRLQSVRAVFEQSWSRSSDAERRVFARLSVFRGGFTRAAASQVAGAKLAALSSLVDKSLLRVSDAGRYEVHALLLQYAREKLALDPSDLKGTLQRHADYYDDWVMRIAETTRTEDKVLHMSRFESELDNLRLVFSNLLESPYPQRGVRLVTALRNIWIYSDHVREGRLWLGRCLEAYTTPDKSRANALRIAGEIATMLGDTTLGAGSALSWLEESLRLYRALNEPRLEALCLLNIGVAHAEANRREQAHAVYTQSFEIARRLEWAPLIASSLSNLANIETQLGRFDEARAKLEEALAIRRGFGSPPSDVASTLHQLGFNELMRGNIQSAEPLFRRALEGWRDGSYQVHYPDALEELSCTALALGDAERAARLRGAADRLREHVGVPIPPTDLERLERAQTSMRSSLEERVFEARYAEGRALSDEAAVAYALEGTISAVRSRQH
jgi:predicted ATPase/DNA-binding SARP family transcriptional activator